MSSDTRDSSVTTCTLTVTDFNLFSCAIQEDTNQFEHKERFNKVRNLSDVILAFIKIKLLRFSFTNFAGLGRNSFCLD